MRRYVGRIMNRRLFHKIYGFACSNKYLEKTAVFVTRLSRLVYMFFFGLGFLLLLVNKDIINIPSYVIVPFTVLAVNTILRRLLNRPRPFVRENIESLVPHEANGSLPSNHAASAMIIAFSWLCVEPAVAVPLMILAFFTGISRVMTGLHYPMDIVCGWIIALIGGIIGFVL